MGSSFFSGRGTNVEPPPEPPPPPDEGTRIVEDAPFNAIEVVAVCPAIGAFEAFTVTVTERVPLVPEAIVTDLLEEAVLPFTFQKIVGDASLIPLG